MPSFLKGKTYDEVYGPNRAAEIRRKQSRSSRCAIKRNPRMKAWNTGLTKDTDGRLRRIAERISKAYWRKSKKERERLREVARVNTVARIAAHPYARFHNTKPERIFKKLLKAIGVQFIQNYPVWSIKHCYPADFYLPEHNTIIEIDGTTWHNFPHGTPMDRLRESEMAEAGYTVLRFWDKYLDCLPLDVLKETLENLKNAD